MISAKRAKRRTSERSQSPASLSLLLIIGIVGFQSFQVSESYGRILNTPLWLGAASLIPALFAIFGYVLAQRLRAPFSSRDITPYIIEFALPLVASVLIGALVIGPIATTDSFSRYFTDQDFFLFFTNLIGWPHNRLPGVFEFNNSPYVINEIYGTLPYIIVGAAALSISNKFLDYKIRIVSALLALLAIASLFQIATEWIEPRNPFYDVVSGSGLAIIASFLFGSLTAYLDENFRTDWKIGVVLFLVIAVCGLLGTNSWTKNGLFNLLMAPTLTYLTIFVMGSRFSFKSIANKLRPYLPAFLLFSYPVQQIFISIGPGGQSPVVNFAVSATTAAVMAVAFWHLVQRKLLAKHLNVTLPSGYTAVSTPELGISLRQIWMTRPNLRSIGAGISRLLPTILLAAAFLGLALGLLGMIFFALQRDPQGI